MNSGSTYGEAYAHPDLLPPDPVAITPQSPLQRKIQIRITSSSHAGSHIDLPRHFYLDGGSVNTILTPEAVFATARCTAMGEEAGPGPQPPPPRRDQELTRALHQIGNGRLRETDRNLYEQAHPEVPGFLHMQNPAPENPGGHRGLSRVPLRLSYGRLLEEPWILRVYPMVFNDIEGGRWWRSRS